MLELLRKDLKLVSCIVIITLLLIARDIMGITVSDIVVTVACASSMAVLKYEKMVYLIFFMFPIMCGVPGYIITIAYLLLLIKGPCLTSRQIVPLIIVIFLEIINELFRDVSGLYTGMLSFLSFTAVFFYFLDERRNLYSVQKSLIAYGIGTSLVFIVIYINMFQQYGIDAVLSGMLRSGALGVIDNDVEKMRGHLALNANTIAYMAISVVSMFSVLLETKSKMKVIYMVITAICFVAGIFSFSRTYIAIILLFVLFLFLKSKGTKKIKLGASLFFVGITILCIWGNVVDSIFNAFEGRMEEDNITTGSGRTILFALYNKAWFENLYYVLFGVGVVTYREVLNVYNAMHNGLQQIWVCLGIMGLLLYCLRIGSYLRNIYTSNSSILYIPFVVTLMLDQSIQFLNPYPLVLILLVTLQLPKIVLEQETCK